MVGFLSRGVRERGLDVLAARRKRLALVKRLGADLTAVIDPHQSRRAAAHAVVEIVLRDRLRRAGSVRRGVAQQHAKPFVELADATIEVKAHVRTVSRFVFFESAMIAVSAEKM